MRGVLGGVLAVLLVVFLLWPHATGPTAVGVRTVKWSLFGAKGVQEQAYEPGATYFFPALINDWQTLDTKLQQVEMTHDAKSGDKPYRDDLIFKTIDGNDISLDVIVSYRIDPAKAPYIVQYVGGTDFEVKDKVVRTIGRSRPRDLFGELKTEEFYISDKRDEKAEQVKTELNAMLGVYGIIVERVSTKDYRFNPAYQKAIEDKKIADQVAEQNKSATKAAQEEYLKKLEDAKGEVNRMVATADGVFKRAQIEADAYYEQQQRIAGATEAEGAAEAKGILELNKALAGSGGEVMVKMKLAEALDGKRILLLPLGGGGLDLKTTNVNQLLELYGAKSLAQGQSGGR
ncbi:MAG: prohibitin family protein [Candidatus Binatia bacterium]